jgi:hypothetical protein
MLFRDEEEDEGRIIIDLEWSNRAWVVVSQLPPLTHNECDSTREVLIYYTLLPSYALYTVIPYRPPPAVGSAERSGPSGPLI